MIILLKVHRFHIISYQFLICTTLKKRIANACNNMIALAHLPKRLSLLHTAPKTNTIGKNPMYLNRSYIQDDVSTNKNSEAM